LEPYIISILGFAAGACTTGALWPQVVQTVRTKQTRDLALKYFVLLAAGLIQWTAYGILLCKVPIILANLVALVFTGIIIRYKIKYG